MNCAEFQELLQQRLDGESIADSDEMNGHRTACCSCRELETLASRLLGAFGARSVPKPSEKLSDQIVSLVMAEMESRQARRRWTRRALAVSSLAAGILLAAFLEYSWWGPRRPRDFPDSNVVTKKDERPASIPNQPRLNFQEAGSTLVALVNRTADETVGQGRVLLPQEVPAPRLTVADNWQPALSPQAIRDAQDGVAVGFEPVTDSARRAVNLFLRELSPSEVQKQ
jgi:hypothetical protein